MSDATKTYKIMKVLNNNVILAYDGTSCPPGRYPGCWPTYDQNYFRSRVEKSKF